MRKGYLLSLALVFAGLAQGAGNDLLINQRNPADTITQTRGVVPPGGGGTDAIMGYVGASNLPAFYRIGSGLAIQSGQLVSTVPAGATGAAGPQGLPGAKGDPGKDGADSAIPGPQGLPGKDGAPSTVAGPAGPPGKDSVVAGPQGIQGLPGRDGTNGLAGAAGQSGAPGAPGATGPAGAASTVAGPQGIQGIQGIQGPAGPSGISKRLEQYIGTTDANGLYTVIYPTPFSARPSIQAEPPLAANQVWVVVSSSSTGFSLRLTQRSSVTLLGLEVLLAATTNVSAAPARVQVVEP